MYDGNMGMTVVIPTLNEERDLPKTLRSLKFANEVLVVDCGSTDKTISIAKKAGARVINHDFINFTDTRNFADKQARNNWILSLEADVVVRSGLAEEIRQATKGEAAAYRIGRINVIFGKKIMHSDWGPRDDNHIRLYHKKTGTWQGQVHEQFVPRSDVKIGQLKHRLIHFNYRTVTEYLSKINFYSDLEVERRQKNDQKFSWWNFIWEPKRDFLKRYFYKLGFLDGLHGFFLAYLQAVYYLTVGIKLYTEEPSDHDD